MGDEGKRGEIFYDKIRTRPGDDDDGAGRK